MGALKSILATSFVLLAMGVGLPDALFLCRTEQTVHTRCCCVGKVAATRAGSEVRPAPCCDVLLTAAAPSQAPTSVARTIDPAPPLLIEHRWPALVEINDQVMLASSLMPPVQGPLGTGPPHRISHCSLLL